MKKIRIVLIALAMGAFVFQSCTSKKKEAASEQEEVKQEEMKHEEGETEMDSTTASKMEVTTVSKEQLEGMLSGYFSVKNALVKTDAKEAKSAAEKLMASLGEGMGELSKLVKAITEKEDVEKIRADFDLLSASMYKVVKANPSKAEGTVYKQFCPMAFNNKGAFWLSSESEIKNPYFGDKMLKCGKVQEEL